MSDYNQRLGHYGEQLAADFLRRRDYKIIDANYQTDQGELDLIAQLGDELLFVEVKTRTGDGSGYPETAVDWRKIKNLLGAIDLYFRSHPRQLWRLDIISVQINRAAKTAKFRWFKNIE